MPDLPRPENLLGWIRAWCERPGMWLVAFPDKKTVNVDMLFALVTGYETALEQLGRPSEHDAFRRFVYSRRPDLERSSDWYGGALLTANGDQDHLRVVQQITDWVGEFERTRGLEGRIEP